MATFLDIAKAALGDIGVIAPGEAPPYEEAADALAAANRLIDQWALDELQIYHTTRTVWDLEPNVDRYPVGPIPGYDGSAVDGYDTTWRGVPPGWTILTQSASATITNNETIFQAGGHSAELAVPGLGVAEIYQDFVVFAGTEATLSLWIRGDGAATGGIVRVQCVETGHFLDSGADWDAVTADVFTENAATFTLQSLTFDVEDELVVGAPQATLRVTLYVDSFGVIAYFDTFALENAESIIQIPRPVSPVAIDHVSLIDTSFSPSIETPLGMLTDDEWEGVTMKALTSPRPRRWYYNPTFPNGTLYVWPVPTGANLQGAIYVPTELSRFAALTDTFSMPPGYERMLIKHLALELAPSYGVQPSPLLMKQAMDAMASVKKANRRLAELSFDAGALIGSDGARTWDIRTGP